MCQPGKLTARQLVVRFSDEEITMNKKSIIVCYLLWFFLGVFGVHKFYLGKTAMGVIYLLTGGLLGIGWFIDLFLIPFQVAAYNNNPYNRM